MKSNKLRQSAKGEDCTLNIAGVCNYNPETTVLAHLPDETKGTGKKSDDISSCFACSDCHDVIDGRRSYRFERGDLNFYLRRAMVRTWRKWIERGIIIVKSTIGGCLHHIKPLGRGEWIAKTMKDAKQMAIDFNEGVS